MSDHEIPPTIVGAMAAELAALRAENARQDSELFHLRRWIDEFTVLRSTAERYKADAERLRKQLVERTKTVMTCEYKDACNHECETASECERIARAWHRLREKPEA